MTSQNAAPRHHEARRATAPNACSRCAPAWADGHTPRPAHTEANHPARWHLAGAPPPRSLAVGALTATRSRPTGAAPTLSKK
jgi:hypothetical protein